jgi:hypothetical protein
MFTTPAGDSFVLSPKGWVNPKTSAPASAAESAAADQALATSMAGAKAVTPAHLPAGQYPAIVVNGQVYAARMHSVAWQLAGQKGTHQFYGFAEIDAAGKVIKLFR